MVLNACATASGKYIIGEGLIGTARAFMAAGARRVIATHWMVGDVPARQLVTDFYSQVFRPSPARPAEALRAAQLKMWKQGKSPAVWAAFSIFGDWN